MKPLDLNHQYTPQSLRFINESIVTLLQDIDKHDSPYSSLFELIRKRDEAVVCVLSELEADQAKLFAQYELGVNNQLLARITDLLDLAKEDVKQFVRSQNAIKNYR